MMNKPTPRLHVFVTNGGASLRGRWIWILLISLALVMTTTQVISPNVRYMVAQTLSVPLGGVMMFISAPLSHAKKWVAHGVEFINTYQQLETLKQQVEQYRYLDSLSQQLQSENQLLRKLTRFESRDATFFITGKVISENYGLFARSVLVALGANDDVSRGTGAMIGHALAGMVVWSGSHVSRVLLLDDINSMMPVVSQDGREPAIAIGSGIPRIVRLELTNTQNFSVGERLVTSGAAGILPANIPVAVITKVEEGIVEAQLIANTNHVDFLTLVHYTLSGIPSSSPSLG